MIFLNMIKSGPATTFNSETTVSALTTKCNSGWASVVRLLPGGQDLKRINGLIWCCISNLYWFVMSITGKMGSPCQDGVTIPENNPGLVLNVQYNDVPSPPQFFVVSLHNPQLGRVSEPCFWNPKKWQAEKPAAFSISLNRTHWTHWTFTDLLSIYLACNQKIKPRAFKLLLLSYPDVPSFNMFQL